jgi:hypothetical protein
MSHRCHAHGCTVPVRPELLMCYPHWRKVPKSVQKRVLDTYRSGQCDDRRPSREWFDAAGAAIGYVALLENHPLLTVAEAQAVEKAGFGHLVEARRKKVLVGR